MEEGELTDEEARESYWTFPVTSVREAVEAGILAAKTRGRWSRVYDSERRWRPAR